MCHQIIFLCNFFSVTFVRVKLSLYSPPSSPLHSLSSFSPIYTPLPLSPHPTSTHTNPSPPFYLSLPFFLFPLYLSSSPPTSIRSLASPLYSHLCPCGLTHPNLSLTILPAHFYSSLPITPATFHLYCPSHHLLSQLPPLTPSPSFSTPINPIAPPAPPLSYASSSPPPTTPRHLPPNCRSTVYTATQEYLSRPSLSSVTSLGRPGNRCLAHKHIMRLPTKLPPVLPLE